MDRKIVIGWNGETVEIVPTMELALDIELAIGDDIAGYIVNLYTKFNTRKAIEVIYTVLNHGGIKVDRSEVYDEICSLDHVSELMPVMVEIMKKNFPWFFAETDEPESGKKKKAKPK